MSFLQLTYHWILLCRSTLRQLQFHKTPRLRDLLERLNKVSIALEAVNPQRYQAFRYLLKELNHLRRRADVRDLQRDEVWTGPDDDLIGVVRPYLEFLDACSHVRYEEVEIGIFCKVGYV